MTGINPPLPLLLLGGTPQVGMKLVGVRPLENDRAPRRAGEIVRVDWPDRLTALVAVKLGETYERFEWWKPTPRPGDPEWGPVAELEDELWES